MPPRLKAFHPTRVTHVHCLCQMLLGPQSMKGSVKKGVEGDSRGLDRENNGTGGLLDIEASGL